MYTNSCRTRDTNICRIGQEVKTQPSHGWISGSIPGCGTKKNREKLKTLWLQQLQGSFLFCLCYRCYKLTCFVVPCVVISHLRSVNLCIIGVYYRVFVMSVNKCIIVPILLQHREYLYSLLVSAVRVSVCHSLKRVSRYPLNICDCHAWDMRKVSYIAVSKAIWL